MKLTQDYIVYKEKEQCIYPIKETDWNRLKKLINGIFPEKEIFQILASISFGVFASAIFSLFAFESATELKSWVLPTTWGIFATSLILGICLLILNQTQKEVISYSTKSVLDEMNDLERKFHNPDEDDLQKN